MAEFQLCLLDSDVWTVTLGFLVDSSPSLCALGPIIKLTRLFLSAIATLVNYNHTNAILLYTDNAVYCFSGFKFSSTREVDMIDTRVKGELS